MRNRSGKPYAGTRLAKYLERRVLELRPTKTQATIATEAGFVKREHHQHAQVGEE